MGQNSHGPSYFYSEYADTFRRLPVSVTLMHSSKQKVACISVLRTWFPVPFSPARADNQNGPDMQKAFWQVLLSNTSGARLAQLLLAIAFPLLALALRWALDPILGSSAIFLMF